MKYKIPAILAVLFLLSTSAQATLVKAVNLQQLSGLSHYIIKATVTDKQTELDQYESGKMVHYYTLKVLDWIKGKPANDDGTIIIKQLADGDYTVNGVLVRQKFFFPQYQVGQTYVFFLPSPHHITGLMAPMGLQQGVFEVNTDTQGNEAIPQLSARAAMLKKGLKNDVRGRFLTTRLNNSKSDQSYNTFKSMIEKAVQE